jgi:hypothetical protein
VKTHIERPGVIAIILHAHKARPAAVVVLHERRRVQPLVKHHQAAVPVLGDGTADGRPQRRPEPVRRRLAGRRRRVAGGRGAQQTGVAHDARVAARPMEPVLRHVIVPVRVVPPAAPAAEADEQGDEQDHGGDDGRDGDGDDAAGGHLLGGRLGRGGRHQSDGRRRDLASFCLNLLRRYRCGDGADGGFLGRGQRLPRRANELRTMQKAM